MLAVSFMIQALLLCVSEAMTFTHRVALKSRRFPLAQQIVLAVDLIPLSVSPDLISRKRQSSRIQLLLICSSVESNATDTGATLVQCADDSRRAFAVIKVKTSEFVTGLVIDEEDSALVTEIICQSNKCLCKRTRSATQHNNIDALVTPPDLAGVARNRLRKRDTIDVAKWNNTDGGVITENIEIANKTFYVAILVVVESKLIRMFCQRQWSHCCPRSAINPTYTLCDEIKSYYLNVMAATKQLYSEIDNVHLKIILSVVDVVAISETRENVSYFDQYVKRGTVRDLDVQVAAKQANNIVERHPNYSDVDAALLFMGHDLIGSNGSSTIGGAYIGQVCSNKTAVIEERFGYTSFFTVIHELAHLLGAQHDGKFKGCGSLEPQLMSPRLNLKNRELAYVFTCCSLTFMYNILDTKSCTFRPPQVAVLNLNTRANKYLGQLVTKDEFWSLTNGESAIECKLKKDPCKGIYCRLNRNADKCGQYTGAGLPTLNGASCDSTGENWCMHGYCVPVNQTEFRNTAQQECDVSKQIRLPGDEKVTEKPAEPVTWASVLETVITVAGIILFCVGVPVCCPYRGRRNRLGGHGYPFFGGGYGGGGMGGFGAQEAGGVGDVGGGDLGGLDFQE